MEDNKVAIHYIRTDDIISRSHSEGLKDAIGGELEVLFPEDEDDALCAIASVTKYILDNDLAVFDKLRIEKVFFIDDEPYDLKLYKTTFRGETYYRIIHPKEAFDTFEDYEKQFTSEEN